MDEKLKQALGQAVAAIAESCGVSEEEAANFVQSGLSVVEQAGLPKEQQISAVLKVCQTIVSKGSSVAKYVKAGVQGFASILQSLMGAKAKKANGGKINAFSMNDTICPAGYEYVTTYAKGGPCRRCMKKQQGGEISDSLNVQGSYHKAYSAADDMMKFASMQKNYTDKLDAANSLLNLLSETKSKINSNQKGGVLSYDDFNRLVEDSKSSASEMERIANKFKNRQFPILHDTDSISRRRYYEPYYFEDADSLAQKFKNKNTNYDEQQIIEQGPNWNKRTIIKQYKK